MLNEVTTNGPQAKRCFGLPILLLGLEVLNCDHFNKHRLMRVLFLQWTGLEHSSAILFRKLSHFEQLGTLFLKFMS